jgi:hypothetical protein
MQTMSVGSAVPCPLAVAFNAITVEGEVQAKRRYRLNFNTANYADSDSVKAARGGVNASTRKCNR